MKQDHTENRVTVTTPDILVSLLPFYGVRRVIVSPGSRNATIIEALAKQKSLKLDMVVDERSAAFVALGYAEISNEPTAIVCTSGTAPLNYAPAIAEAYYRRIPLVVLTADRPAEWINQDDSQTLPQPGIYGKYIKTSVDIPVLKDESGVWYANRMINEALIGALCAQRGPVHINVQIADRPEGVVADPRLAFRSVTVNEPRRDMTTEECRALGCTIASPRRVMIIAGFHRPSSKLNRALSRLAEFDNIIVLTETISNLHNPLFIGSIDRTLKMLDDSNVEALRPDVVITLGGALVSRRVKAFLRTVMPEEHWHVGLQDNVVDVFRSLTSMIRMAPEAFFEQFASAMQPHRGDSRYADSWRILSNKGRSVMQAVSSKAEWSDLKAFETLIPMIPKRWNVQYSNGTPIRYAQLFGDHAYHRCDCNRGVSGIDGCTSTAVGSSMAYGDVTLLVTGDMSAYYDLSGLAASSCLSPRFKMIVISNGGGGIFRFVNSTKRLEVRDRFLCGDISFPAESLAASFGFRYFRAVGEAELRASFADFAAESELPAMLEILTPGELSAEILDKLLN